jgi:hypothetical protein
VTDYLALILVIAIGAGIILLSRGGVWRRCRCGDRICNGCGRHR